MHALNFPLLDPGTYYLSQPNGLCAEAIGTVEECRSVDSEIVGGKHFKGERNSFKRPKGCFLKLLSGEPDGFFWNNHPSGSPNIKARQICIVGKEGRIVNI